MDKIMDRKFNSALTLFCPLQFIGIVYTISKCPKFIFEWSLFYFKILGVTKNQTSGA